MGIIILLSIFIIAVVMTVKEIKEGMTAPEVAQTIKDNFDALNTEKETVGNVGKVKESVDNANKNTGVSNYPAFSATEDVAVGVVRNYNGLLYRSIVAGANEWNEANWERVSLESLQNEKLTELAREVIYDVSANNDGATFASLSVLLSSENLSTLIPTAVRCGGMSIRFVQSSDNKYVQYRLKATSFSTNEDDWQGVDDEPAAGSKNLVESGGVFEEVKKTNKNTTEYVFESDRIFDITDSVDIKNIQSGGYYDTNGNFQESSSFVYQKVDIDHSKIYKINLDGGTHLISSFVLFDSDDNILYANGGSYAINSVFVFPQFVKAFGISSRYSSTINTLTAGNSILKIGNITTDKIDDNAVTSSKISAKAILSDKINDLAVTPSKCTFFTSKNLYDYTNTEIKHGYYLYDNVLYENETYFVSQFLKIESGTEYLIKSFASYKYCRWICYYDENENFLNTHIRQTDEYVFTTPENAKYLRFTGYDTDYNKFVVSTDTDIDFFIPYKPLIYEDFLPVKSPVLPDVVVTRKNYILNGVENSIYFKDIMSFIHPNYAPDKNGGDWLFRGRCMRTDNASGNLSIKLIDIADLTTIKTASSVTCKGLQSSDDGAKVINVIGDSFTYNGKWFDKINDLCPNLSFVGMRKSYNTNAALRAEGRGGWTLHDYATKDFDTRAGKYYEGFSPFLHPSGYTYYGVTGFWADIVNNNIGSHIYEMNGFDDFISMFGTDGKKLNPSTNDMMYDTTQNSYIYYNGSSWVTYSGTPTFEFNYSKYITAWGITSPDFVLIMLGVNDFFSNYTAEIGTRFVNEMQALITSIQAYATSANKTITIGICTNNTISALPSSNYGTNNVLNSRYLFNGRKKVISTFDNATYEAQNVYVVDTAATFDADYGFNATHEKPFSYYGGDERELYDYNGVHPSDAGYAQLGTCAAGFIQYMRGL